MRHSLLCWLTGLLAVAATGYALHALVAQDRAPRPSLPAVPAQGTYRLARNVAGDSKPIVLDADEISTWVERSGREEHCVVLLRGNVLVQQNVVNARFQQAVAWIDLKTYKDGGALHVQLFGEGEGIIDTGVERREAARAVLDITTRGEFRLRAHRSRVSQDARPQDPLVQRGRVEGLGPAGLRPAPPAAQASPAADAPVRRATYERPPPPQVPAPLIPFSPPPAIPPGTGSEPRSQGPQWPSREAGDGFRQASYIARFSSATLTDVPGGPAAPGPSDVTNPPLPAPGPLIPGPPIPPPSGLPPPGSGPPTLPAPTILPPPSKPTPPPPGAAVAPARNYTIAPRRGQSYDVRVGEIGPDGYRPIIVTGGVIVTVRNVPNIGLVDLEADRLVIWNRGADAQQAASDMQRPEGQNSNDLEFYLAGNVELRQQTLQTRQGAPQQRTIRAEEIYYDVNRNVAVAYNARLEMKQAKLLEPLIVTARELLQINVNTFEVTEAVAYGSKLPSDPDLTASLSQATIEDRRVPQKSILGRPVLDRTTGQPLEIAQTIVDGQDVAFEFENVPFFYLPHAKFDARDPFGPLQDINFGYSRIFGVQFGVTLNVYQLIGLQPPPTTTWRMNLDYLSYRGPGVGTNYNSTVPDFFTLPGKQSIEARGYAIYDRDYDILGGPRPMNNFTPADFRGRLLVRDNVENLPEGFNVLAQLSALSDRNFLEQYFKREFDLDTNQATVLFVKQQQDNWAWSALVEPRLRNWVTETQWLPRLDGWLIGQSFFDRFTYTAHPNVAFAAMRRTNDQEATIDTTDETINTGRFDLMQELDLPLNLGPFKFVPYGMLDLTEYTNHIDPLPGLRPAPVVEGGPEGRVWGALGARASLAFSRIYPGVESELWNLNGINHKIVFMADYINAWSNEPHTNFPQLDRLNDDATDQALRDITPLQPLLVPGPTSTLLQYSPIYDPQVYALRRLVLNRVDTLDTIQELAFAIRQRWQTKRGYPGMQHIVDWMKLDLSASWFPAANRDNFGNPFAFLEYNYLWNIGDRTALTSQGWIDPYEGGPRFWAIGGYFNRPDRTTFYLGFREIEPVNSRAVTGSVTYVFSPKYAMTGSSTYDFGTGQSLSNTLMFTRIGSDLQISLGFTYNALQSSFGALFQIAPVLLPTGRSPTLASGGGGGFFH